MKIGVIVFPGSNCDRDCVDAGRLYLKQRTELIWHGQSQDLSGFDLVLVPGGFSYGDHLRAGAIARFAPIMGDLKRFADRGGLVLGICNGFQILTESGLLPGALRRNQSLAFNCDQVSLTVENNATPFSNAYDPGARITLPIAHAEGNYYADPDTLQALEDNRQVIFRYTQDVNGSVNRIAGICNAARNVLGMMPHPERSLWPSLNFTGDGRGVFDSIRAHLSASAAPAVC